MASSLSVAARGLITAALLVCGGAHAQETPLHTVETTRSYRLTWAAPDVCPSERDLSLGIVRLLATSTLAQSAMQVVVSARVETGESGSFYATIEIAADGATSLRNLEATSCDAVASATALIIATVIDPEAVERAQAADDLAKQPPAPLAGVGSIPALEPTPQQTGLELSASLPLAPASDSPARSPSQLHWSLAALSWGGVGMLPNLAYGVGASLTARRQSFSAQLEGQFWPKQRRASADGPEAGADFERLSGGARACFRVLDSQTSVDSCAGAEVIHLRGRGYGDNLTQQLLGEHTWLAPMLGGAVVSELRTRIALIGRFELSFPLSRHFFEITGTQSFVYRLPPIGARAGLGIALTF